jgi:hypothetical protein
VCLADVSQLTADMIEPRVLTPRERLEALLMAASIEERAEAERRAPMIQQPQLIDLLERSALLLRQLAS